MDWLTEQEECMSNLTYADQLRMHTLQSGDPVADYYGFPLVQAIIIAEEKAARLANIVTEEVQEQGA